jgi:transcriptional regulator with XRE-family HTH domain
VRDSDPRPLFGKRLRELLLVRGFSQERLAELADLHRNYVGGIERGERNVSLVNIVKLAHALTVKPSLRKMRQGSFSSWILPEIIPD